MSQQINLFNPALQIRTKLFAATTLATCLGVLLLAVVGVGVAAKIRESTLQAEVDRSTEQLEQARRRLADVSAQYAPRESNPALAAQLAQAQRALGRLKEVSAVIERGELGNTQGYAEYFRALARQKLDGVWLTGVGIVGAGLELGVRGRALEPALVASYLGRLRREPTLQGKPVANLQIAEAEARKTMKGDKEVSEPAPYVEFSLQSTPLAREAKTP